VSRFSMPENKEIHCVNTFWFLVSVRLFDYQDIGYPGFSALHVKHCDKGAVFFSKKIHNFRRRPDNRLELCKNLQRFQGYGKIIELSGPDIYDLGFFFIEKADLVIAKRSMSEKTPVFPGFLLGPFLNRTVPVYNNVVIVPDTIDLNPPIPCIHTGKTALMMMFSPMIFIYF